MQNLPARLSKIDWRQILHDLAVIFAAGISIYQALHKAGVV